MKFKVKRKMYREEELSVRGMMMMMVRIEGFLDYIC